MEEIKKGSKKDLKQILKSMKNGVSMEDIRRSIRGYSLDERRKLEEKIISKMAKVESSFMFTPYEEICIKYADLSILNELCKNMERDEF